MSALSPPTEPIPVLFLVTHLDTGGAERQLAALVTRMDTTRFRPIVVCQKGGGPFLDEILAAGVEAYRLEIPGRWDPRFWWRLAALCRRLRVRAMVIRGFSTGVVVRLVGRALGIRPLIMAEHSTGRIDPDPKKRPIERLLAPLAHGVIAVAKGQVPFLVEDMGFDPKRIRVIYNGIDLTEWRLVPRSRAILQEFAIPESAPVVGILAMLRPEKDHETFLRGARVVLDRLPEARFLIVGDGSERERLQHLAAELDLEDRVLFPGRRTDVARLLSVFDVTVLTSVTIETFPMSFLEAMAMECALIATPVGGVPEMIEEGKNGYIVPMRDPHALADAIVKVVSDREIAAAMGRASREIVEQRFTITRMVQDTENYILSFFPAGKERETTRV
jgi:glycosyltransferase involved in cell wall biosynthesis